MSQTVAALPNSVYADNDADNDARVFALCLGFCERYPPDFVKAMMAHLASLSPTGMVELAEDLHLPFPLSYDELKQRVRETKDVNERLEWMLLLKKHPESQKEHEEKERAWWTSHGPTMRDARKAVIAKIPENVHMFSKKDLIALYIEKGALREHAEAMAKRINEMKVLHGLLKDPEGFQKLHVAALQEYNMRGLFPLETVALMGHLKLMRKHPNPEKRNWYITVLQEKGKTILNGSLLNTPTVYSNVSSVNFPHGADYASTEVVKATPLPSPSKAQAAPFKNALAAALKSRPRT